MVKGAVDRVLAMCTHKATETEQSLPLTVNDRQAILMHADHMGATGLRGKQPR